MLFSERFIAVSTNQSASSASAPTLKMVAAGNASANRSASWSRDASQWTKEKCPRGISSRWICTAKEANKSSSISAGDKICPFRANLG